MFDAFCGFAVYLIHVSWRFTTILFMAARFVLVLPLLRLRLRYRFGSVTMC